MDEKNGKHRDKLSESIQKCFMNYRYQPKSIILPKWLSHYKLLFKKKRNFVQTWCSSALGIK